MKKQLQQSKTESNKNYLERKCATLDKQIEELVYQPACRQALKIDGRRDKDCGGKQLNITKLY